MSCGSAWSQTFSYDPFGNIKKSGTISFQPTYSATTNRMTSLSGANPTYDANGNLTMYDSSHTYAWDGDGNTISVEGVGVTYDALDRAAEQNRSGTYTQIVYAPSGFKLALMNGQTLNKAFVPLPGGATAVYNSGGLAYYRHPDWLGSSRLASTPSKTIYSDTAYAPFGEAYAQSGTADVSFTAQNADTTSDLYDFTYRENHPVEGRWLSPDRAGLAAVAVHDPQTWNRYPYLRNSPLTLVDANGLCANGGFDANGVFQCQDPNPPPIPTESAGDEKSAGQGNDVERSAQLVAFDYNLELLNQMLFCASGGCDVLKATVGGGTKINNQTGGAPNNTQASNNKCAHHISVPFVPSRLLPDYVQLNGSWTFGAGNPVVGAGFGGTLTLDRYGNLYLGGGPTFGLAGGSASVTGGKMIQPKPPSQAQLQQFISGAGSNWGLAGSTLIYVGEQYSWPGEDYGKAAEFGIGNAQGFWNVQNTWQIGHVSVCW